MRSWRCRCVRWRSDKLRLLSFSCDGSFFICVFML
nr:MAG TPA: hypothetical protein [Bacteriophage sp.]